MIQNDASPMRQVRGLLDSFDGRVEDALTAHGFVFVGLSADQDGASLRFDQPASAWRLTICLPSPDHPELRLQRGDATDPDISLLLRIDGLARSLSVGMSLLSAVEEA